MILYVLFTVIIVIIASAATYFITKKKVLKTYYGRNSFLEKEIEAKKNEIAEVKHKQTKFWSVITHELKNVFYKLYNSIDLLNVEYDDFTEEEKKMLIQTISKSYNYTLEIIDELMEWTRVNIHSQNSTPEDFNLRVLAEETMQNMEEKFTRKEIKLVNNITGDMPIYCDRVMLNFVLKNILQNALKYSYRKGQVEVSCKKDAEIIVLRIDDHGMGISKADQSKLFNIDEIFSTEGTEKEKGAGLGLIISKDFIELNNGNIVLLSEKEKGTSVIITLPMSDK